MFHPQLLCTMGERECAWWLFCNPSTIHDPWNLFYQQAASFQLVYPSEIHCSLVLLSEMQFRWYTHTHTWENTCLILMDPRMCNKPILQERTFCYFLLSKFTWRKLFLWLMRCITMVGLLVLWDGGNCCWGRWSNIDFWCCCWWQWSNRDCWCCCWQWWSNSGCWYFCWRWFFPFKHLCKVLRVVSSSL